MLQGMLSFLGQKLFVRTQCKPADTQMTGETDTGATGNCRDLQAGLQGKAADSSVKNSKEISRSDGTPKKTTVLIMVAPPTDFQQVG